MNESGSIEIVSNGEVGGFANICEKRKWFETQVTKVEEAIWL